MDDRSLVLGERWAIQQFLKAKIIEFRKDNPEESEKWNSEDVARMLENIIAEISDARHWR